MALPIITPLPDPPSIADPANFETQAEVFLSALAPWTDDVNELGTAMPGEINSAIAAAVAAYDPDGAYSAVQVDALFAERDAQIRRLRIDMITFSIL